VFHIIFDTFLYPADRDYVQARMLSINKMYRGFYWSACQCIEKYLKANLLMFGQSIKSGGHNIVSMAKKLDDLIHGSFLSNTLEPCYEFKSNLSSNWGSKSLMSFLQEVNKNGDPSNRYDYFHSIATVSSMFKLDQTVQMLRSRLTNECFFEHISNTEQLTSYLYELNKPFSPSSYEHGSIYNFLGSEIHPSTLERAVKGCYGDQSLIESWIKQNLPCNKNDMHRLKNS
jgi:hypothetical protein